MHEPKTLEEATTHAKTIHPDAVAYPCNGEWEIRIPIHAPVSIPEFSLEMEGTPAEVLAQTPVTSPHYSNELERWGYPEHRRKPIAVIAAHYNLELIHDGGSIDDDTYQRHLKEISELHDNIRDAMDAVRDWDY